MDIENIKIDKQVLEKALRKKLSKDTVKILEVKTDWLTAAKGINFLSELYKVHIVYTVVSDDKKENANSKHSADFVVKVEPSNGLPLDMVQQQNLSLIEFTALHDIVPRIEKLIQRQLAPTLFYGSKNPFILVMENLFNRGFMMKNRQIGFSIEHCRLAIEQIARLHAGSVAIFENDPELIKSFSGCGIISPKCPKTYLRLMEVSLSQISSAIERWSDEKFACVADKLRKLIPTIGQRCIDASNYDEDEFCVLNHGDCWINNIMFREDERNRPIDLLFVDLQMIVYTSPAIDLIYFLNICPEFDVKYDNDDYLLKVYLDTLSETMETIGCKRKPPTMEQLKEAIYKRRIYAIFSGIVLHLRMMANNEDTEDFNELFGKLAGETKLDVFKNPDAIKIVRKMIPIMDERKYFELE